MLMMGDGNIGWMCNEDSGRCYQLGGPGMRGSKAEEYCIEQGGHLASILSEQDQEDADEACGYYLCWVGLERVEDGILVWTDGTNSNYTNWRNEKEMNTFIENEDYGLTTSAFLHRFYKDWGALSLQTR